MGTPSVAHGKQPGCGSEDPAKFRRLRFSATCRLSNVTAKRRGNKITDEVPSLSTRHLADLLQARADRSRQKRIGRHHKFRS
jgi:hypothetical protein